MFQMRRFTFLTILLVLNLLACARVQGPAGIETSLLTEDQRFEAFLKTRGSTDPTRDVVFYWKGNIYARSADAKSAINQKSSRKPILKFEGFNIARFVPTKGGVQMLSREVSFYQDLDGRIIDCWTNPWTETRHRVVHVFNDPVNFKLTAPTYRVHGDTLLWSFDINLIYPSALSLDQYPGYSSGDEYRSMEIFNFAVKRADLQNPTLDSVPTQMTWSRVGQFLPWMKMGNAAGELVYSTSGYKVLKGFKALPKHLRSQVTLRAPQYQTPPQELIKPNMTSWRYFKQQYDNGKYTDECMDLSESKEIKK